jgi:biopolymer transport protein ExbD
MSLIPEKKLIKELTFNLAPMIDFLFIMLAFFATLAVSRAALYDSKLDLVQVSKDSSSTLVTDVNDIYQINLSISKNGEYKWITEIKDYQMESIDNIQKELHHQYRLGLLPKDKSKTHLLLHIDKNAPWQPIAQLIHNIKKMGFEAHPIYEPENENFIR